MPDTNRYKPFDPEDMNPENEINRITGWIKDWFHKNRSKYGKCLIPVGQHPVQTLAAVLCTRALGTQKATAVILTDGRMDNIDQIISIMERTGVTYSIVNAAFVMDASLSILPGYNPDADDRSMGINQGTIDTVWESIRTAVLYGMAAQYGRTAVANTMSKTDIWLGRGAKYGNYQGDFAPLAGYTETELLDMMSYLKIPYQYYKKDPDVPLSDILIRDMDDEETHTAGWRTQESDHRNKIMMLENRHMENIHKQEPMPYCDPERYKRKEFRS